MYKYILFVFILLQTVLPCHMWAQKLDYRLFQNISLGTEASVISCFLQDTQGLIWIGSDKGLFSYDGYSTQPHFIFGERSNTRIYCGEVVDSTYLYLGADNGLLIYNYRTDTYEEPGIDFPTDIRTLVMYDGLLWLGTLNGLYTYHPQTREISSVKEGIPHQTIYSLIHSSDHQLYIGTYNGCCRYTSVTGRFEMIELPASRNKSNLFVNSLLEDAVRKCIWIGTEGCLFKYTPADGQIQRIDAFHDNSVKSMALDGYGQLLVGTDNGLYIYGEDSPLQHIVHDSRNLQSLSNNIVWTVYADCERNMAYPWHVVKRHYAMFPYRGLPGRGKETSFIPCCVMCMVIFGLGEQMDLSVSRFLRRKGRKAGCRERAGMLPGTRWEIRIFL